MISSYHNTTKSSRHLTGLWQGPAGLWQGPGRPGQGPGRRGQARAGRPCPTARSSTTRRVVKLGRFRFIFCLVLHAHALPRLHIAAAAAHFCTHHAHIQITYYGCKTRSNVNGKQYLLDKHMQKVEQRSAIRNSRGRRRRLRRQVPPRDRPASDTSGRSATASLARSARATVGGSPRETRDEYG